MSSVIEALSRWQRHAPDAVALKETGTVLSYAELAAHVSDLAGRFVAENCRCIGILADNGIDWIVADLAALASGATVVPVPLFFSRSQLLHLLSAAPIDTLLVDNAVFTPPGFVRAPRSVGSLAMFRRTCSELTSPPETAAVAKITFTSGSTGEPKGVCLSNLGLEQTSGRLSAVLRDLCISQHLCVMPLATLLENVAGVYVSILLGAAINVLPLAEVGIGGSSSFNAEALRKAIDRSGAQSIILLPQTLKELTSVALSSPWPECPLRFVAVGGACISEADLDAATAAGIPAYQGYGLSECNSVVALNRPGASRRGSVGLPLPGVQIEAAEDGELLVRGPSMLGYLGELHVDGRAIHTGDLGHVDDDGFVYVAGRKKNLFITSFGRNVSPEWPEAELLHQPAIAQAAVYGEGQPINTAIIVPSHAETSGRTIAAAIARANLELPDYARVSEWIVADEPFTAANGLLTATGKPRREAVLARYLSGSVGRTRQDSPLIPLRNNL